MAILRELWSGEAPDEQVRYPWPLWIIRLLLLPTDSNKLLLQWKGPYEVVEVVNRMDYKIDVNGVVSTYHANMLKLYVERRNELSHCLLSAEAIESVDATTMKNFRLMIVPFRRRRSRNRTVTSVFQMH